MLKEIISLNSPLDMSMCKNISHGAVFIVASGASAKSFPLHEFKDIPMIVVNGAISMFEKTSIKPFFYVCTDSGFFTQQEKLFQSALRISQRVVLRDDYIEHKIPAISGDFFVIKKAAKATWKSYLPSSKKKLVRSLKIYSKRGRDIGFSKDLSNGYFDARTVAYLALQLAYHAGFNKVFMVGVDLQVGAGRFYETQGSNKSPCALDEHLQSRIIPSFKLASKKIVSDNFSVFNLSKVSKIPTKSVPYVDLNAVKEML